MINFPAKYHEQDRSDEVLKYGTNYATFSHKSGTPCTCNRLILIDEKPILMLLNLRIFALVSCLFYSSHSFSDNPGYWQQKVDYEIEVELDDTDHELKGNILIRYQNNSPDTLSFLYFHLWPNAYKNNHTAFAKQQLENGHTSFHFSEIEDRGFIDTLDFKINGDRVTWAWDSNHVDICKLLPNEPLPPGGKIIISTPFHVKIPKSFSRLGHVNQSYQITQWYPKPAVYDKDGWHPMPYLDQGEFYSEFGSFEVKITLPKNYVVGASGELQNKEEIEWLNRLADSTWIKQSFKGQDTFPPSDTIHKTLHYKLNNAHDFAWFADKRFQVLKGEVILPHSGRKITTWAMFTNRYADQWKKSLSYLHDGAYFYSKWIGDYPYGNLTAVEGALSAGAGMEYPTITIIGATRNDLDLETVIVHEIGHNWFYGALGSNERMHPWMDEGINSFYERRYLQTKYPDLELLSNLKAERLKRFLDLESYKHSYRNILLYLLTARTLTDQPINLPSEEYTDINYGTIVYAKAALAFDHLNSYLGDALFDQTMQEYYKRWQFKHPQPEDLRELFESMTGKNLDWFFDDLLGSTKKIDYKISGVKKDKQNPTFHEISIKNTGAIPSPFSLSAMKADSIVKTTWYEGFENEKTIQLINDGYHHYRIDGHLETLEFNRKNDTYRLRGMMNKAERMRFQLFGSLDNPYKTQLFFSPAIGWNNYDKTLVGFAFYNHLFPAKKFEFELVPMFGTASFQFVGLGRMAYTFYTKGGMLHNVNLSLHGKRFSYDLFPEVLMYNKIQPVLTLQFRKNHPRSSVDRYLALRSVNVFQDYLKFDPETRTNKKTQNHYIINEATFTYEDNRVINPFELNVSLQQSETFGKLFGEVNSMLTYNKRNKGLFIRIFTGAFLWDNSSNGNIPDARFRTNFSTGTRQFQKDYLFDELFLGRNEANGIFSQQVFVKDGGFRSLSSFGQTRQWITSVNLTSTIPGRIPIRPYLGISAFGQTNSKFNLAFEGGITLAILPDIFEINIPLVTIFQVSIGDDKESRKWYVGKNREDNDNLYRGQKYWELISFVLNIKKLNPFDYLKEIP